MSFYSPLPESSFGWAMWGLGIAVQVFAVYAIVRDVRGRRVNGWDVAAFAFIVALGPGAAMAFLAAHAIMERLELRRQRRAFTAAGRS